MHRVDPDAWLPQGVRALEQAALDVVRSTSSAAVVAGPGAGKTELLAQRASYLLQTRLCPAPYRILAISFKRDAANNLKERVKLRCGPELARRFESYTFDAWAKSLIDRFRLSLPERYRPTADYVLDKDFTREENIRPRLLSVGASIGVTDAEIQGVTIKDFFLPKVINVPLNPDLVPAQRTYAALAAAVWQSALHSGGRSTLAFPMLGVLAELLLRTNPILIRALRQSYKYVFLDEFQDTTESQYRLLHTAFHGSSAALTAVGDEKQRIMVWAGAKVDVFQLFTQHFQATPYGLVMNYRSAPRLVAIQHALISALEPAAVMPRANDDGSDGEGECRLLRFPSDIREAVFLAEQIQQWIQDGVRPEDICILTRQTPARFTTLLQGELQRLGIGSRLRDALQDLLAEPITSLALDAFRVCSITRAPERWHRLCAFIVQLQGLDDDVATAKATRELSQHLAGMRGHLLAAASAAEIEVAVRGLVRVIGEQLFRVAYDQYIQQSYFDRIIKQIAETLASSREAGLSWPEALDAFEGVNVVPIMTIHKSKGLEFHSVILIGLEDYPFRDLASGSREEDCNFFVAFSRAKKRVIFTAAGVRNSYSQARVHVAKYDALMAQAGVTIERLS